MGRVFSILGRIRGCVFSSHQDSCNSATSGVFAPVELKIGVNTIVVKSNLGCLPRGCLPSGATAATAAYSKSLVCPCSVKQRS